MKLIIDIPEEVKNRLCFGVTYPKDIQTVCEALNNGIPIPDNATNGEVIRALFEPNWISRMDDVVREEYEFDTDWWNAPYQKGGKE